MFAKKKSAKNIDIERGVHNKRKFLGWCENMICDNRVDTSLKGGRFW